MQSKIGINMIRILIFQFLLLTTPLFAQEKQPTFSVVFEDPNYKLFVKDNGKTYLIEPENEDWYLDNFYKEVVETLDLDGDGYEEALLRTQGGGNCCGPTFFVISKIEDGFFSLVTHEELSGWPSVSIRHSEDAPELWVYNVSEGFENTSQESTLTVLKFRNGALQQKAKYSNVAFLVSGLEVTADDVSSGENKILEVDLDFDGRMDQMLCSYWARWGAVSCDIKSSKHGDFHLSGGCNRIGVLETSTDGMRDLVCNRDDIFRFDKAAGKYDYGSD